MKKIFLILFLLPSVIPLAARDFDAITPSGHTIYCDVVQGGAKVVGWDWDRSDTAEPTRLTLPSYVRNGDVSLRLVAIGDSCFRFYWNLLSVEIPSTVKTIGRAAFSWCYGLGSLYVPAGVDSIGTDAFCFIPNVEYSGTAQGAPWGAYNLNAYHEGQYYYSDNQKTHIVCCSRDITEANIPPTVTSIGAGAFAACVNIKIVADMVAVAKQVKHFFPRNARLNHRAVFERYIIFPRDVIVGKNVSARHKIECQIRLIAAGSYAFNNILPGGFNLRLIISESVK